LQALGGLAQLLVFLECLIDTAIQFDNPLGQPIDVSLHVSRMLP
jgi:hypothetical protein